jgi:hypothetical protein
MPDRIAVVANCQAQGIVACLRALLPTLSIDPFYLNRLTTQQLRRDAIVSLKRYDLILSQNMTHARFGPFTREGMERRFSNIVFFPQIIFRGFHPDDSDLEHNGRRLRSPLDNHHSLLLAATFRMNIAPERAVDLFNAYIFARLEYFDEYDLAKSSLVSYAGTLGYDLASSIDEWKRSGPFMYLPTHPSLRVLSDIAGKVVAKAGIPVTGSIENLSDILMSGLILPVYPALAKRLGFTGSTSIRLGARKGSGPDDKLSLAEFARQSYRLYTTYPKEVFDAPRIKAIRAILREERVLS